MIYTTLNRIYPDDPCEGDWIELLRCLGKYKADDEPLPLAVIVKSIGLDATLEYCRRDPEIAEFVLSKAKEYFPAREKAFCDAYAKRYSEAKGPHKEKHISAMDYGYDAHFAVEDAQTAEFLRILEGAA
jgi:hypothetical protein